MEDQEKGKIKDEAKKKEDLDGNIIYTTTREHFEYFKKQCEFWVNELGINYYKFRYTHEECEGAIANCYLEHAGGAAFIGFATKWRNIEPTEKEIEEVALHEVIEVLFGSIDSLMKMWFSGSLVNEERHRVIRVIENYIKRKWFEEV